MAGHDGMICGLCWVMELWHECRCSGHHYPVELCVGHAVAVIKV